MKQRELRQTKNSTRASATAKSDRPRSAKGTSDEKERMLVHIRAFETPVSKEVRQRMRQKVDRRFRKFAGSIERISIRISDVNGPKGGVDKACRLKAVLRSLPSAVFKHQAASLDLAFNGALDGAERMVRRVLQRRRTKPIKKRPRLVA